MAVADLVKTMFGLKGILHPMDPQVQGISNQKWSDHFINSSLGQYRSQVLADASKVQDNEFVDGTAILSVSDCLGFITLG